MRIKNLFFLAFITLFVSCIKEDSVYTSSLITQKSDLDDFVYDKILSTNEPFDWETLDDENLFKSLEFSDNILVVGYSDGINTDVSLRDKLLSKIYQLEGKSPSALGELDDVLIYKDDVLGFFSVKINKISTLKSIRKESKVLFAQPNEYVLDLKRFGFEVGTSQSNTASSKINATGTFINPFDENKDYLTQVEEYDDKIYTKMIRHNVDKVYQKYGIYGEGIGVAILDNGILPEFSNFFENSGFGERENLGFFNPLWKLNNSQPDGISPQSDDLLGISQLIEGLWTHGSDMMSAVLLIAPNSNIKTARSSSLVALLFADGIIGVSKALTYLANDDEIQVASMSMGTVFVDNRIGNAVRLFNSKGKILCCAAGTFLEPFKKALGVLYPANMPQTIAVTGIEDRTTTDGEFIVGSTAHTGRRVDFCVERNQASSEATSTMAGMFTLIWSANPSLTSTQIVDIATESSYFYQNNNQQKNVKFGWGTVDVFQAFEMAINK